MGDFLCLLGHTVSGMMGGGGRFPVFWILWAESLFHVVLVWVGGRERTFLKVVSVCVTVCVWVMGPCSW